MHTSAVRVAHVQTRPLNRALRKELVFKLFDLGQGGSGGPRETPQSPPWAFPGRPGASRRSPGPKTNQCKKPRNLKALIKQWCKVLASQLLAELCSTLTPN